MRSSNLSAMKAAAVIGLVATADANPSANFIGGNSWVTGNDATKRKTRNKSRIAKRKQQKASRKRNR